MIKEGDKTWYIVKPILFLILFFFFALVLLMQIAVWLPFAIYRFFLKLYVRVVKTSELLRILDPLSAIFADDDFTKNSTNCSIVCVLKLRKKLDKSVLIKIFEKNVFSKTKNYESHCFEKLKYYPASFGGYWFWKLDNCFKIENHISESQLQQNWNLTECVDKIHQDVLNQTYFPLRSPWSVTLYSNPNTLNDSTILALRLHHCIGDGRSVIKLIVEGLGGKVLQTAKPNNTKPKSTILRFCEFLSVPILLVHSNMEAVLAKIYTKNHPWRLRNFKKDVSPFIIKMSKPIPLHKIKSVEGKGCTSAILMAVITEATSQYLAKNGQNIEEALPTVFTLHKPNHPKELHNHFYTGIFHSPTNLGSLNAKILKCNEIYTNFRNQSLKPFCLEVMLELMAVHVRPLRKHLPLFETFVTSISNLAGENQEFYVGNCLCMDFSLSVGQRQSSIGVLFTVFSYQKNFRFCVVGKQSVLKDTDGTKLVELLQNIVLGK